LRFMAGGRVAVRGSGYSSTTPWALAAVAVASSVVVAMCVEG
jgi:hypothetical protein